MINQAILGHGIEFFVDADELYAIVNGTTHPWHEVPELVKQQLQSELNADAMATVSLKKWGLDGDHALRQFATCRFGGFNHQADLSNDKDSDNEYYDCGHRGACAYEGRLCHTIRVNDEHLLGFRELQVIRLIGAGLLDKQIADVMGISVNTVTSHVANIRTKTNSPTRTAIAAWAFDKGII
jgi:DNA-binding CsgD family transcriptional regulator